jgi:hypothetical protein
LKIINALELNALLGELKKMGWIDKLFGATGGAYTHAGEKVAPEEKKDARQLAMENIKEIAKFVIDNPDVELGDRISEAISSIRELGMAGR